jgi:hypothetical protein
VRVGDGERALTDRSRRSQNGYAFHIHQKERRARGATSLCRHRGLGVHTYLSTT